MWGAFKKQKWSNLSNIVSLLQNFRNAKSIQGILLRELILLCAGCDYIPQ